MYILYVKMYCICVICCCCLFCVLQTKEELQGVRERLTDLTGELRAVLGTVQALNSSLDDIVTSIDHVHQLEEAGEPHNPLHVTSQCLC